MTSQTKFLFILLILSLPISGIDVHLVHRQINYAGPGGISISLTFLIAVTILSLWILGLGVEKGGNVNYFPSITIPAMLLICAGILSMLNSTDKLLSISAIFQYAKVFLVYFITANMVRNEDDLKLVIRVLLITLIWVSLLYILQNISRMGEGKGDEILFRARGAFGSSGTMGHYTSSVLLIALGVVFLRIKSSMRTLALLAFITGIPALILTFARTPWIDGSVCMVLGIWYGLRRRWFSIVKFAGLLVVVGMIALLLWPMISYRLNQDSAGALTERINLMIVAWNIIKAHPIIGIGINNYYEVYKGYIPDELRHTWIRPVHNQYLLVWAEMGIIGLSAFVWFLLAALKGAIRCVKRKDNLLAPLSLGIFLGLLSILLDMNWGMFVGEEINSYICLLIGIIAAMEKLVNKPVPKGNLIFQS